MKGIPNRTDKETAALWLVAGIRFALGDNGTRMQDELIDYCRELKAKADAYDGKRVEDQINACFECSHFEAILEAKTERDRYRAALESIRDHHEEQRQCWESVDDMDRTRYHEERRNVAMMVLEAQP